MELAAGTGRIAKHIVHDAKMIGATDSSSEIIRQIKRLATSLKPHFSVQDMFDLSYADGSFDAIVAANVLHMIPESERALKEIRRVLTREVCSSSLPLRTEIWGKSKAEGRTDEAIRFSAVPCVVSAGVCVFFAQKRVENTENDHLKRIFPPHLYRVQKNRVAGQAFVRP